MKITMLGLGFMFLSSVFGHCQGLENIIVEKYYVSNAADSAGSIGALPVGSVTYRIYVDMLPGYKFQAAYGVPGHVLKLSTTTSFFNNEDRGATIPGWTKVQARNNSVMLDSWFSVGGACSDAFGILKSEDNVAAGGATVVNVDGILQNADASAGIPLTTQDGIYKWGTRIPATATVLGFTAAELAVFDVTSQVGNLISTSNASWSVLGGTYGYPDSVANKVLIAQVTTNGCFHYELNIQIGTTGGVTENYVAMNPVGAEIQFAGCMGSFGPCNVPPTVSITSPSNGANFTTGAVVAITATAADSGGTVSSVEFFVDGISIGIDNSAPYTANYPSVLGPHCLTARATDNLGAQTTTACTTINVANNTPPTVSITFPANNASFIVGAVVPVTANASDNGSVASVEFFVDGVSLSIDNSAPYAASYTSVLGSHCLTARATDNLGAQTTTACDTINVVNNPPPTVNITSPANNASFIVGVVVPVTANASDNGSVASVEFFVDGVSLGIDNTAPYAASYTSVLGSHCLTARAIDNLGAQTTTACDTINVVNNPPPTVNITSPANNASFNIGTVVAISANASDNGSVASVEFFVDGVSVGIDNTAAYTVNYTSVLGSHTLTARATDNLGVQTTSAPVSILVINPNAQPYKVGTIANTCLPNLFCLPVTAVDSVKNVIGYDVVMNYNKTKVVPTGSISVSNALVNPGYVDVINSVDTAAGLINISLYFNATAPANTHFLGIGNIFCVEFIKTINFSPVDTASFSISSLQESYFNGVAQKLVDPGKYITYKDSIFNGSLKFWYDNSPLKYDAANPAQYLITNIFGNNATCSSQSAVAVQPDLSGNFSHSLPNGLNISIQRDIPGITSVQPVVNGFDALLARKVLLNDLSFIPSVFQLIAMDVNIDGVISAGDVSQLNQRTVLMIPEFKQAWNYNSSGVSNGQPSKDWLFIDSSTVSTNPGYRISATYPSNDGIGFSKYRVPMIPFCLPVPVTNLASCPVISTEAYKGVLLGDVNGNFATVGSGGLFRTSASDRIVIDLSKAVKAGNQVDVPVSVLSDDAINALDFSMQLNEEKLTFNSFSDHTNYLQALANFNATDRTLRFTSNSLQSYDLGKAIVSLRFSSKTGQISEKDLNSLEGYLNGERVQVKVVNDVMNISNDQLVSIYPNPASGMLTVEVTTAATVQLLDMGGRQIIVQATVNANQKQEINIQNIANGIYIMKIYNDSFVSMKKLVINHVPGK